jgi:hypothetical protein
MIFGLASWIIRQQCSGYETKSDYRLPLGAKMLAMISQLSRLCMPLYSTSQIYMRCLTGLTFFLLVALKSIFKNLRST